MTVFGFKFHIIQRLKTSPSWSKFDTTDRINRINNATMDLAEVESRTQRSKPRPRTQKNLRPRTTLPRTDTLETKGRNARGQEPRTLTQVFSKKKTSPKFSSGDLHKQKVFKNFFEAISKKNDPKKILQILATQKLVLSSSQGQGNFRGLEASRPKPRT